MANLPVRYSGVVLDGLQAPARVFSYLTLPDSSTLAQVQAALGVWAQAVDGVIDGAFVDTFATLAAPLPAGLKGATGATWAASYIGNTGVIDFSATGTSQRWGLALPTFSLSLTSGGKVLVSSTQIQALVNLLTNPTKFFTNADQQSLEAALDALLSFRKHTYATRRTARLFT